MKINREDLVKWAEQLEDTVNSPTDPIAPCIRFLNNLAFNLSFGSIKVEDDNSNED